MTSTSDANTDDPSWPTAILDPGEVRAWIASALPGGVTSPSTVAGPVEVYQENGRGVTARFAVAHPRWASGVVFHASPRVIYAYTPAVYRLLMPRVPNCVPELVACTEHRDQAWTLFRAFAGEKLSTARSLGALEDLARSMAGIQAAVAGLPGDEWGEIPHLPVGRLLALFDEIVADIRDVHLAAWRADDEVVKTRPRGCGSWRSAAGLRRSITTTCRGTTPCAFPTEVSCSTTGRARRSGAPSSRSTACSTRRGPWTTYGDPRRPVTYSVMWLIRRMRGRRSWAAPQSAPCGMRTSMRCLGGRARLGIAPSLSRSA